jgi:hypothetical protein
VNREQMIDFCAEALYDSWAAEENQRRAEADALRPIGSRGQRRISARVVAFGCQPERERELWRTRARPMVLRLERERLIAIGDTRIYNVLIDDPDLVQRYEFTVEATTPQMAAYEGARLAVRRDPLRFLNRNIPYDMRYPLPTAVGPDVLVNEQPGLIDAVAMYAYVREPGSDDIAGPEDLWGGYSR